MIKDQSSERVTRKSAGFFRFLDFFQSTPFLILLFIGLTFGVGFIAMLLNINENAGVWDWKLFLRDVAIFSIILSSGIAACVLFREKTPFFNFRMATLMNSFGTGMFAFSYLLGNFIDYFLNEGQHFVETFFMIGSLISYIVLFVIFFSFTSIGQPWYILLALVQPSVGILIYSFFSAQLTFIFLTKAVIFFVISALVFAAIYGPLMAHVSIPYRKRFPGVGGYKFLRAFVESLLLENRDEAIERFFEEFSEERNLVLDYVIFKDKESDKVKGLFVIPNTHFGPFKTCGSAALPEKIYKKFKSIPGLTVFHTTSTHASNFSTNQFNSMVISQIKDDLEHVNFSQDSKSSKFIRLIKKRSKLLGILFADTPFLMFTQHPFPTDDIEEEVGEKIKKIGKKAGFKESIVIDCHNSLIGDEVLIQKESEEAIEMENITNEFLKLFDKDSQKTADQTLEQNQRNIKKGKRVPKKYETIYYGTAKDEAEDIPISWGIGTGGIIVHLFRIGNQDTALVHIDANNALTKVRPAIINLGENQGVERVELSTSDTHAVVRILSAQGYYPLGTKVSEKDLVKRITPLIKKAKKNLSQVKVATFHSKTPGYRFWKDLSYFELIIETIERAVSVSKFLLTIGLIFPGIITLLLTLFWLG